MSTIHRIKERGPNCKLLRKYQRRKWIHFPSGSPCWWRKIFFTGPRHHKNKHFCRLIQHAEDSERFVFPWVTTNLMSITGDPQNKAQVTSFSRQVQLCQFHLVLLNMIIGITMALLVS